jgi:hypothetical protein
MTRFLTAATLASAIALSAGFAAAATVINRDSGTHAVYWYEGDSGDVVYIPAGGTKKVCDGCTLSIGGVSFETMGNEQYEIVNGTAQLIR